MSIESIVRTCNKQAMEFLCNNNYGECYRLLKKAEEIINSPNYPTTSKLSAVTLNNLGCYYKRIHSYDTALEYLKRALNEDKENDSSTVAGTHLNILAVLSSQKKHEEALLHGIQALKMLQNTSNLSTLIVALQCTGDEYLAVGDADKALATFKYGLELAKEHFGSSHEYTLSLFNKYHSLSKPEKKFYFEKLNKRATKQIFSNFRNYSVLPKLNGPIRPSKSLEKSPPPRQKINQKMRSERIDMKSAPQKQKSFTNSAHKYKPDSKMNILDDTYIKLEEKINSLQNQLENFEVRYKQLENYAKAKSSSRKIRKKNVKRSFEENVIFIQKFWRGYRERKQYRLYKRKMTHERAKRAIEELEILRKEAIKEDLYGRETRPKTNAPDNYRAPYERTIGTSYQNHRLSLKPC